MSKRTRVALAEMRESIWSFQILPAENMKIENVIFQNLIIGILMTYAFHMLLLGCCHVHSLPSSLIMGIELSRDKCFTVTLLSKQHLPEPTLCLRQHLSTPKYTYTLAVPSASLARSQNLPAHVSLSGLSFRSILKDEWKGVASF